MSHIFISYSRRDLAFAQKIVDTLAANDLDTWVDWKSIPKGEDWEQEIYQGIETADAFLFLISLDSVASEMCNKEITHAVKNGKRILPIFVANVDNRQVYSVTENFLGQEQKAEINRRNFIFCRQEFDDFDKAIREIQAAIHTDYQWLKYHTELQAKALEWDQKKDNSRLLRGKELREAEEQLAKVGSQKEPQPTELHRKYVLVSQRNEVRRRRQVTVGLSAGMVIVIMLAIFAWVQRNVAVAEANSRATAESNAQAEANAKAIALVNEENARATAQAEKERAEEQAIISLSRQLAAQSVATRTTSYDLSLLLSLESINFNRSPQSLKSLLDNIQAGPNIVRFLERRRSMVEKIDASSNDIVAILDGSGLVNIWKIDTLNISQSMQIPGVNDIAINSTGTILAVAVNNGTVELWEINSGRRIRQIQTGKNERISTVDIEFGNNMMVFGSTLGNFYAVNLDDFSIFSSIELNPGNYYKLKVSPIGDEVAIIDQYAKKEIILWTISDNSIRMLTTRGYTTALSFDVTGQNFVTGDSLGYVDIWSVRPGEPVNSFQTNVHNLRFPDISDIAVTDDFIIVSNEQDPAITVWSRLGKLVNVLNGHSTGIRSLASVNGGSQFISGGADTDFHIIFWDLFPNPPLMGHNNSVDLISYSPDNSTLTSVDRNGKVILWSTIERKIIKEKNLDNKPNYAVLAEDKQIFAAAYCTSSSCSKSIVSVWGIRTLDELYSSEIEGKVEQLAISPENNYIAIDTAGKILLWKLQTNEFYDIEINDNYASFFWSSKAIYIDEKSKVIYFIRDMQENNAKSLFGYNFELNKIVYGPLNLNDFRTVTFLVRKGKLTVVTVADDNIIQLWDVPGQNIDSSLIGQEGRITSIAYNPKLDLLASGSTDGRIMIWDLKEGLPLGLLLNGHKDTVFGLDFESNGNFIASGSFDRLIKIWNIDMGYWEISACEIANRNFTHAEWKQYIGKDIPYHITCPNLPIEPEVIITPTP